MFLAEGAVAGAVASVVVESALYPIDTIKTRLQDRLVLFFLFMLLSSLLPTLDDNNGDPLCFRIVGL
jgi:hypothetical protein